MANVDRRVTLSVVTVTLSAAKGLVAEWRCFAALSMTVFTMFPSAQTASA
jgi:hypothetical protein